MGEERAVRPMPEERAVRPWSEGVDPWPESQMPVGGEGVPRTEVSPAGEPAVVAARQGWLGQERQKDECQAQCGKNPLHL